MPSVVEPPNFEKVEQIHFEPEYWSNVYVVGDVHGCFDERRWGLPATVDEDDVSARFNNRVLTVEVPKEEAAETGKTIEIE